MSVEPKSQVVAAWDTVAQSYDSLFVRPIDVAEDACVQRWVNGHLGFAGMMRRSAPRVLDIGCGTGLLLELASVDPAGYLGVDPSAGMIERARGKHRGYAFSQIPVEELRRLESFDVALSLYGSLSYADPEPALDSIADAMAPGAVGMFMLLSPRYARRRAASWKQIDGAQAAGDYLRMEAEEWERLARARFSNVEIRGFRYMPDPVWSPVRSAKVLGPILQAESRWLGRRLSGASSPFFFVLEVAK